MADVAIIMAGLALVLAVTSVVVRRRPVSCSRWHVDEGVQVSCVPCAIQHDVLELIAACNEGAGTITLLACVRCGYMMRCDAMKCAACEAPTSITPKHAVTVQVGEFARDTLETLSSHGYKNTIH